MKRIKRLRGRVAPLVLLVVLSHLAVPAPVAAQTQDGPSDAELPQFDPNKPVGCEVASAEFKILCATYNHITSRYVGDFTEPGLIDSAIEGVRDASLPERTSGTPPVCPIVGPFDPAADLPDNATAIELSAFKDLCAEIDRVLDTEAAAIAAADAMLASLADPNARRLTREEWEWQARRSAGRIERTGIGVEYALADHGRPCTRPSSTCRWVVTTVYPGSPAEAAGVEVGDVITKFGNRNLTSAGCMPVGGLDSGHSSGASVRLETLRDGTAHQNDITVETVAQQVVYGRVVDDAIGYIRITDFPSGSGDTFAAELQRQIDAGISVFVLDLRGNGGGSLGALAKVAEAFLDADDSVYTVGFKFDNRVDHVAADDGIAADASALPLVVVVNADTDAGAETAALALREHQRATVIGTTTAGRGVGSSPSVVVDNDGRSLGAIQVTDLRWWGPNLMPVGDGIVPDFEAPIDDCLHPVGVARLAFDLIKPQIEALEFTSLPAQVAYTVGETITVTVTFDRPVTVSTSNGTPTLVMTVGTNTRQGTYQSSSHTGGRSRLTFDYTVGDEWDPGGVSVPANAIGLNGGTIDWSQSANVPAGLDHQALADDRRHSVRGSSTQNLRPLFTLDVETREVAEHTASGVSFGTPVAALDLDTLTYSLDTAAEVVFDIDAASGQLRTEAPLDHETRPSYVLTVTASDTHGTTDTVRVDVSVIDEDDPGTLGFSPATPRVSSVLRAVLVDPDNSITGEAWAWERSTVEDTWDIILNATSSLYRPTAEDFGRHLRATVVYGDKFGSGKELVAVTANPVAVAAAAPDSSVADDRSRGSGVLIVANGWSPPDIGVAAALSARTPRSAVLLTDPDRLSPYARDVLVEYLPARVIVVGGDTAVSPSAYRNARFASATPSIERIWGATRVETAAAIARQILGAPGPSSSRSVLIIANGWRPPDVGLAAVLSARIASSAVAYSTDDGTLPAPTRRLLSEYRPGQVFIVGGTEVVPQSVEAAVARILPEASIARVSGPTRVGTAEAVARRSLGPAANAPPDTLAVVVANGWSPPDIGVAAVLSARTSDSAVVYVDTELLPPESEAVLRDYQPARLIFVGGTAAISEPTGQLARTAAPGAASERYSGTDRTKTAAAAARHILGIR